MSETTPNQAGNEEVAFTINVTMHDVDSNGQRNMFHIDLGGVPFVIVQLSQDEQSNRTITLESGGGVGRNPEDMAAILDLAARGIREGNMTEGGK